MSVELRPLGVTCNIACQYCYQHPQRDVEDVSKRYDMALMKDAILKEIQQIEAGTTEGRVQLQRERCSQKEC